MADPNPTVTAFAPGRVNLIGEHTDYNDGLCLPFALPMGTTVRLTPRSDGIVTAESREAGRWQASLEEIDDRTVTGWASYVAGVVWALRRDGIEVPGCDLEIASDVPLGAGLSSSASLECAVAVAVAAVAGLDLDHAVRRRLAEVCRRAETEYVGAPTGGLDQLAVMLAAEEGGVLIDFGDDTTRTVPLPLAAAGLAVLVTDTRVEHTLADGSGYGERRTECERALDRLGLSSLRQASADDVATLERDGEPVLARRVRHQVSENDRVGATAEAVEAADWSRVGRLLSESHASLRDDYEVTVPALDVAVAAALEHGALGARMTGGGFGGSTIALVAESRVDAVRDGINAAFATAGLEAPAHLVVRPGPPAHVVSGS